MSLKKPITLILNDETITAEVAPNLVALDYLRQHRSLTGSKEGCKEGDCGACSVILGELVENSIRYRAVTSCLLPMGELHGKHLVSIEGINLEDLSPIQRAMVECGGTQCGYCTPGFVVAMTAGLMDESIPLDDSGADYAISGNLCRCTGYRSIKEAGRSAIAEIEPRIVNRPRMEALCDAGVLPTYFREIPTRLGAIPPVESPSATEAPFIAGGTDLFVQRGEELPKIRATLLNTAPLEPLRVEDSHIIVDARETFESFGRHPVIQESIPLIAEYNAAIASWPIRERATLGGNICNASPIADMTALLLAMDSELFISSPDSERWLPLSKLFLGYKRLAKTPEERITSIRFPKPEAGTFINWEKVSKRRVLDIAAVNSAAKIRVANGRVVSATISLGGVAPTPLVLSESSEKLVGRPLDLESIAPIIDSAQNEFEPISDVRGDASYKRLLARQLLWAHFQKFIPENMDEEALYEALR
jgi:xanthine dehydrogenase small subunit